MSGFGGEAGEGFRFVAHSTSWVNVLCDGLLGPNIAELGLIFSISFKFLGDLISRGAGR